MILDNKNHARPQVAKKNLGSKKTSSLWYPFLIAAYPVLGLLAYNLGQARPAAGLRPMAAAILVAAILLCLLRLLLRDWHRAAFVASVWMGLMEAYGHVYESLQEKAPEIGTNSLLGGVSLLLGAAALFAASRPRVKVEAWASSLNVAALALVAFPLAQILWYEVNLGGADSVKASAPVAQVAGAKPDIYYIVLDMYTRADTLEKAYGYDNSEFLGGLEQMGFSVAECSMSNYTRTELSLASSLNMTYITSALDKRITKDSLARSPMWNLIRDNAAMQYAQAHGYKTVAFATGFPWSELDNADQYYEPDPLRGGLTEFESLWLDTTAFRVLEDEGVLDVRPIAFARFRERTEFVLDTLPAIAQDDEPTFAFVHLILPHPPFVFAADGGPSDPLTFLNESEKYPAGKFAEGYTAQVTFANREITRIVREIIASSDTPPVIILQGDHGPWLQPKERHMTILNAYYLPGHEGLIAPDMSPVNTFRLVFDLYLGGDFGLLQNISYYSPVPKQYDFSVVPNNCRPR